MSTTQADQIPAVATHPVVVNGQDVASPAQAYTTADFSARVTNPADDQTEYLVYMTPRPSLSRRDSIASDFLPPYQESEEELPAYTPKAEPSTLAAYLFKFGFFFPPFWIICVFILLSPLRIPEGIVDPISGALIPWLPGKTEAERQQILLEIRRAEVKWAKRSLYAILSLGFIATIIGLSLFFFRGILTRSQL